MAITLLPPFAKLLRRYRVDAQLTQEELAEKAGLSARAISDLERGVKIRPHRVTVELLGAVPRCGSAGPPAEDVVAERVPLNALSELAEARPVPCPPQLREVLEGLVGLYVDEDHRKQSINITVIMFSVGGQEQGR
jgi:transcriptional regulator with XRE-family HTH domain